MTSLISNKNFFQHAFTLLIVLITTIGLVATIGNIKEEITEAGRTNNRNAADFILKYQIAYFGIGATLICVQVSYERNTYYVHICIWIYLLLFFIDHFVSFVWDFMHFIVKILKTSNEQTEIFYSKLWKTGQNYQPINNLCFFNERVHVTFREKWTYLIGLDNNITYKINYKMIQHKLMPDLRL